MPYGVVLKDERPTSNIERPTSNEKNKHQMRNKGSEVQSCWFCLPASFFSFHSKFDVGRSMFDVHLLIRSMFIFFFSSSWAKTT